jgi:multidrug efflux pump subunit AcrA (membrane-fusion protein)
MPEVSKPLRHTASTWLARHVAVVHGTLHGAVLLRGTQGIQLVACQPAGCPVPAWLASTAASAVARREAVVLPMADHAGRTLHVVANPLVLSGTIVGAAVVVLDCAGAPDATDCAALAANAATFSLHPAEPEPSRAAPSALPPVLELLHETTARASLQDAAAWLATSLAGVLACDRVSIGFRHRNRIRLAGSSDGFGVDTSAQEADVCAAMDEAIDNAATIVYPTPAGRPAGVVVASAHLSNKHETRALCTLPLVAQGEIAGALLAERGHDQPFSAAEVAWLEALAQAVAPWLAQRHQLDLPPAVKARQAFAAWMAAHGKGRHRLAALALILAAGALLGWPTVHEVAAPVKLEGAVQRILTSPGDNFLQKVMVRPGDAVKAGQVLLEFAAEDLQVERQRVVAELGGQEAAVGDAMAREDFSALALRLAKSDELKAQLALLDQRLEKARIVAPFDAIVIQGDLGNALGAPTKKGDVLMTLAPANDFRAIVEVDDTDIADVRIGQTGAMVLTALPDRSVPLRVKRITPLAAVSQGRSFFEVEVQVGPGPAQAGTMPHDLRPGMRGVARLTGERRPRGAVWLQQASTWVRLAWWRWIG